jgi:nucleoside 2-deoxyribosyltransferase
MQLDKWADVYLPQRDGELMRNLYCSGIPVDVASRRVFQRDLSAIRNAHCLIAVLDGRCIDEGVSFELGVAYSLSTLCVGFQTDSRRLAPWGNNPMIAGALHTTFDSMETLSLWVRELSRTHLNHAPGFGTISQNVR